MRSVAEKVCQNVTSGASWQESCCVLGEALQRRRRGGNCVGEHHQGVPHARGAAKKIALEGGARGGAGDEFCGELQREPCSAIGAIKWASWEREHALQPAGPRRCSARIARKAGASGRSEKLLVEHERLRCVHLLHGRSLLWASLRGKYSFSRLIDLLKLVTVSQKGIRTSCTLSARTPLPF